MKHESRPDQDVETLLTKIKALETELTQAKKGHSLSELSSQISHEVNNLISIMLAHTQSAKRTRDENAMVYALEVVADVSAKIMTLLKSMTDYVHGKCNYRLESPILPLKETLDLLKPRFESASIDVVIEMNEVEKVSCDLARLQQVFLNLLSNAIDAMEESGSKVLTVKCYEDERYVSIEITDTGVGMEADVLENIFRPFFSTKEGEKSHAGIGLTVCKDIIVKEHLGKLSVESLPNVGTTFIVSFRKGIDLEPPALFSE